MPVRFRCAYCNQLLGISRRKIGTVVRCPTCAGSVLVPTVDDLEPAKPLVKQKAQKRSGPAESPPLFERSDIDELLQGPFEVPDAPEQAYQEPMPAVSQPLRAPAVARAPSPPPSSDFPVVSAQLADLAAAQQLAPGSPSDFGVELVEIPLRRGLTRTTWILLGVGVVLLVLLAFGLGYLLGRSRSPLNPPPPTFLEG